MEAYIQSNKSSGKLSLTLLQGCDTGSMNWVCVLRHSAVPERWSWGPPIGLAGYLPLLTGAGLPSYIKGSQTFREGAARQKGLSKSFKTYVQESITL